MTVKSIKKVQLSASWTLAIALLIVVASAKMLVLGMGALEDDQKIASANLPPLPQNFQQNQLSAVVYDGYLNY